jgi:hypothetical protein
VRRKAKARDELTRKAHCELERCGPPTGYPISLHIPAHNTDQIHLSTLSRVNIVFKRLCKSTGALIDAQRRLTTIASTPEVAELGDYLPTTALSFAAVLLTCFDRSLTAVLTLRPEDLQRQTEETDKIQDLPLAERSFHGPPSHPTHPTARITAFLSNL